MSDAKIIINISERADSTYSVDIKHNQQLYSLNLIGFKSTAIDARDTLIKLFNQFGAQAEIGIDNRIAQRR